MPARNVVAKELAQLLKSIAHPDRIRLIEELRGGEADVNTLAETLDIAPTRASQHLGILRVHRVVDERREGRHHIYHLVQPEIANWIIDGLAFVEGRMNAVSPDEINDARQLWESTPVAQTDS
ncbi:MAG: metalloregulator ArsR/SmtB family transcription factor [Pseudomonadota bacterium]